MDNTIIRKYDIRGIVGKALQINDGYEIGRKFGQTVASVCVGYDSRIDSPGIERELIRGLTLSGVNVIRVGLCSSPMLYAATQITQADLGIIITASLEGTLLPNFVKFIILRFQVLTGLLELYVQCVYQ